MTLDVVVMTSGSRRLAPLLERLGDPARPWAVVRDPGGERPSSWRTARLAWQLGMRPERRRRGAVTHRLVIQDDAIPCDDFLPAAENAIAARPDALVAFYVGDRHVGASTLRADAYECRRWSLLPRGHFVPTLALAMPLARADELVRWADGARGYAGYPYDDEVIGVYRDRFELEAWATIPCLVEHDNSIPSVMGHAHHGPRVASCSVEAYRPAMPPGEIDWTRDV